MGEVSCLLTVDDITGAGVQLVQCDKTRPGNYCVSKCGKRVGRYKLVKFIYSEKAKSSPNF